nr:DUF5375 family protein [Escherichia coli]
MKTPLPPVLRAALYRRAVACAWLTVCERQHRYPHLTLESLEAAIAAAADACEGVVALPPVFGDWNDAFTQYGGEATRKAIYDAIRPPAESPFDTMSEAEFSAMSTSEKDELCARHIKAPVLH